MAFKIDDKENSTLDIYPMWNTNMDILELKDWVDTQIELGMKSVGLDISWGYYDDIDGLSIKAEN